MTRTKPLQHQLTDNLRYARSEFKSWLSKNANEIVGWIDNPSACPLHSYLEQFTNRDFEVYSDCVSLRDCYSELPTWARKFVCQVDEIGKSDNPRAAVYGQECLSILEAIEQEMGLS